MAFTKTPMQSTEQNKTVSLFYQWDSRNDSSDNYGTRFENAIIEPIGQDYFQIMKRDGSEVVNLQGGITGRTLGVYYWGAVTTLVVITQTGTNAGTVYRFNGDGSTLLGSQNITWTNNIAQDAIINFQEYQYQNGKNMLFFNCWTSNQHAGLFVIDGVTSVLSSVSGGGSSHSIVAMDSYLFTGTTTAINGSNVNDPLTFGGSNFINVDSYPDITKVIARAGPYIVALGAESIQYYYDAGNPTGTVLGAQVGATKHIGYLGGFCQYGDDILFIGQTLKSAPQLYRISGLKITPIASAPLARMWLSLSNASGAMPWGNLINLNGHTMYMLRTPSVAFNIPFDPTTPTPTGTSYMYDLDTEQWSILSFGSGSNFLMNSSAMSGNYVYFTLLNGTQVYRFNRTVYQDAGTNFTVRFKTKMNTFDTRRMKFGEKLTLDADQTSSTSYVNVSWSDNDFQSYSTPRQIDVSKSYQQLWALGSFRARSFQLTYTDNFPMRFRTFELDYDQGTA